MLQLTFSYAAILRDSLGIRSGFARDSLGILSITGITIITVVNP